MKHGEEKNKEKNEYSTNELRSNLENHMICAIKGAGNEE